MSFVNPLFNPLPKLLQKIAIAHASTNAKTANELLDFRLTQVAWQVLYWRPDPSRGSMRDSGNLWLSQQALADSCHLSARKLRGMLRLLARFGLLTVISPYKPGSKERERSCYAWHPQILEHITGYKPLKPNELNAFVAWSIATANRRTLLEGDWQGFDKDVPYLTGEVAAIEAKTGIQSSDPGSPNPTHRVDPYAAQKLDLAALNKESKKAEGYQWRLAGKEFVTGAAKLWNAFQQELGRPAQLPTWYGEYSNLGPTNQKAYRELVKIFESEGGYRACLGWFAFCSSTPGYDNNGKLIFDPSVPHRQWVTADKQPAHFAKYFNSIMADPELKRFDNNPTVRGQLELMFGDKIVNQQARWVKEPTVYVKPQTPTQGNPQR